jgi:NAD(P)H dehydrogenase (quinone)
MIVVTGAGGKTGKAVVKALVEAGGEPVWALVRRADQAAALEAAGARKSLVGDLRDPVFWGTAFQGARAVYHICPNMSPDEVQIADFAITAAREAGVEHIVYHSVLHPQVEAMPHHWQKMRVEERLFASGLPFTILQPAAYMQNLLAYWDAIVKQGIYAVPYSTEARISIVDLEDVAAAAARVITSPGRTGAIYELAGPEPLSQIEVADIFSAALNRPVVAQANDRGDWERRARAGGMDAYSLGTLLKMFEYYDQYGLVGNPGVLEWVLGRAPGRFRQFVDRSIKGV